MAKKIEIHEETVKTGKAVFSKDGILSFAKTKIVENANGDKEKKVVATFAIDLGSRDVSAILREVISPALANTGIPANARKSLGKHLTTTSLPVWGRTNLPNGFTGTLSQALNAAGAKGDVVRSEEFIKLSGLLAFTDGDVDAAWPMVQKAMKSVKKQELTDVAKGVDPWMNDDDVVDED